MKGKFIVFEGLDGAGKSTQIQLLSAYLKDRNIEHICTSDLGGTEFGAKIRELFLDEKYNLLNKTEVLLMIAAREEHINKVIVPALNTGKVVLCDRFVYSTIAYQLGSCSVEDFYILNGILNLLAPQVAIGKTIYLDIPVKDIAGRKTSKDRIERKSSNFYKKVLKQYNYICDTVVNAERIDATHSIEEVHKAVLESLQGLI